MRTLRSSILQPPCSIPDIESRLDCVKELITSPQMLTAIQVIASTCSKQSKMLRKNQFQHMDEFVFVILGNIIKTNEHRANIDLVERDC